MRWCCDFGHVALWPGLGTSRAGRQFGLRLLAKVPTFGGIGRVRPLMWSPVESAASGHLVDGRIDRLVRQRHHVLGSLGLRGAFHRDRALAVVAACGSCGLFALSLTGPEKPPPGDVIYRHAWAIVALLVAQGTPPSWYAPAATATMRERADLIGAVFEAGPIASGGWQVRLADRLDGQVPKYPGQAGDVVAGVPDDDDVRLTRLPLARRDEPFDDAPELGGGHRGGVVGRAAAARTGNTSSVRQAVGWSWAAFRGPGAGIRRGRPGTWRCRCAGSPRCR